MENIHKTKRKVAVDIHHLQFENAGTKRVTLNILQELSQKDEIQVFEFSPVYQLGNSTNITGKLLRHLLRFFWVHIHLPFLCYRKKIDILLSPEFNTPIWTNCKRAVIVHDVHMRAQREFSSSLWFYCYYIPFIECAIKRADLIITISAFSKQEIIKWMKVDANKIEVVYWGVDPLFLQPFTNGSFESLCSQYAIFKNKYLLFIGTFEARKNVERIIEAFSLLQQRSDPDLRELKLVIAGNASASKFSDRSFAIKELVKAHHLSDKVVFCGFIPDNALADLYGNALCLLFPSLYEGFGFPLIEGFATGIPVITSTICSMPEIAGGAALLADPYSVIDIERNIYLVVKDSQLRDQLISAGKKRVEYFSWPDAGDKFVNVLMEVLKTSSSETGSK